MNNSYFSWKQNEIEKEQKPLDPPKDVPSLIRTKETGDKIYRVKDGYAHWVTNPEALKAIGGNFGSEKIIDKSIFRQLRLGDKITVENAAEYMLDYQQQPASSVADMSEIGKAEENRQISSDSIKERNPDLQHEFKKYDEPQLSEDQLETLPKQEPEKGFTSIIIPAYWVHYPAFHFTGNCIGTIREHTDKLKTPYEIILVINGKTGITIDRLEQTYADKVIQLEENVGFAKAVNKGIRVARGEYIAIVNNDVMVWVSWLEGLQEGLKHLDLVMATPMYGNPFARQFEAVKEWNKYCDPIEKSFSDFVDFSCVLTRKEMFNKIGLFDEQFFMYGEDLDLLRRMKQQNLKYASTKAVRTTHIIGATSTAIAEMPQIMNESKAKLKAKWGY